MIFGRQVIDSDFGRVKRSWGRWVGKITFAPFKTSLDIVIKTPRNVELKPYLDKIRFFVNNFEFYQEPLALQLFADYNFYRKVELEEGIFSEEDFLKHPGVEKSGDIWNVLSPRYLWVGDRIDKYHGNAYVLFDVDWPNPHYFQVFLQLEHNRVNHIHTELVG
jgi:hypothetical protein